MTQIVRNFVDLQEALELPRAQGLKIGFVPTMGALHAGHLSLVELAKKQTDFCVVSIFVNPTQFAPHEDFASYPRQEQADLALLEKSGVSLLYAPSVADIYPGGPQNIIKGGPAAHGLESDFRPHFFDGVASVVYRLFEQVQPYWAGFGEKDYQQLCVIREMVQTKALPIIIGGGAIIRDSQGLALSSRNAHFNEAHLKQAQGLNKILFSCVAWIKKSFFDTSEILSQAMEDIRLLGFEEVQYLELRDASHLRPIEDLSRPARLLVAARLAGVRLIDNVPV